VWFRKRRSGEDYNKAKYERWKGRVRNGLKNRDGGGSVRCNEGGGECWRQESEEVIWLEVRVGVELFSVGGGLCRVVVRVQFVKEEIFWGKENREVVSYYWMIWEHWLVGVGVWEFERW